MKQTFDRQQIYDLKPYPEMSGHQSCKSYIVAFLLNELYSAT